MVDAGDGLMQAPAVLGGQVFDEASVLGDGLLFRGGCTQAFEQIGRFGGFGCSAVHVGHHAGNGPHMIARGGPATA
jgi:hypothetical protein